MNSFWVMVKVQSLLQRESSSFKDNKSFLIENISLHTDTHKNTPYINSRLINNQEKPMLIGNGLQAMNVLQFQVRS